VQPVLSVGEAEVEGLSTNVFKKYAANFRFTTLGRQSGLENTAVNSALQQPFTDPQIAPHLENLHTDGVTVLRSAFTPEWTERMREDMMTAFWEAIQRPGGAVGRGPRRWYVEIHPQAFSGFADLAAHPWVTAMCEAVLGPHYEIVEIGLDTPFQGAKYQPWHRDFASPRETYEEHRITSLAFNLTGVDVTPDMGPFEIAKGTQWDDGRDWQHEMFPPNTLSPRYSERGVRSFPAMGDVSCRSALTIHRGTAHASPIARPVAGPRRGCTRRRARSAARCHGHTRLLRRAARYRTRTPRVSHRRRARAGDTETRH